MKHSLKSLLITTILIVPTMFAAEVIEGEQETSHQMSIVELGSKAGELARIGRSKAAARVYADSVNHADIEWFNILFAAGMIERLGYPKIAIEVYQHSMEQSKTRIFASNASDAIQRLKQVPSGRSKSTLDGLSKDIWVDIGGFLKGERLCAGWLNLQDLSNLALVLTEWHQYASTYD